MKNQPKPSNQSPLASLTAMFNRTKAGPQTATPANLGAKLAEIKAAHGNLVEGAQRYLAVADKAVVDLDCQIEGQRKTMQAHRDEALKVTHLPDALLAAELATAEREVVTTSCLQALRNVDTLTGDPETLLKVQQAVNPLRELLAALPKQPAIHQPTTGGKS